MASTTPVVSAFTTGDNTVFFTNSKHHVQYPSPLNGAWNERALFAGVTALEISSAREKPSNTYITTAICTRTGTEVGNTNKRLADSYHGSCFSVSNWSESPKAQKKRHRCFS
jgi:hypothetical protein